MAYTQLPTRNTGDINAATDINTLQANIEALKGGSGATAPTTTIESLESGKVPIVTDVADADAAIEPGVYWNSSWTNTPSITGGLITFRDSSSVNAQIFMSVTTMYRRTCNGAVWTSWYKVWDENSDGSGSGLDADLLDGNEAVAFVFKSLFNANTILKADTDDTPAALTVAEGRIIGRKTGGSIAALTADELLGVVLANQSTINAWSDNFYRQCIINGGLDVWQEYASAVDLDSGASLPSAGSVYAADTFLFGSVTAGPAATFWKSGLDTNFLSQRALSFKITALGTAGTPDNRLFFGLFIEGSNAEKLNGKKVSFSFKIKADNSNVINKNGGDYINEIEYSVHEANSLNDFSSLTSKIGNTAVTHTDVNTTVQTIKVENVNFNFETYKGIRLSITIPLWGTNSLDSTISIGDFQMNIGEKVLPFMPRRYDDELRAVRRYYKNVIAGVSNRIWGNGQCISTTQAYIFIPFSEEMVKYPTLVVDTTYSHFAIISGSTVPIAVTNITLSAGTGLNGIVVVVTVAAGLTAGYAAQLQSSADAYIGANAR